VFARIAATAIEHRRWVFVAALLLTILAAVGATRLRLDFGSASFYGDRDDQVLDLREFHERWGLDDDTLIFVARVRAPEDTMLTDARLDLLSELADELRTHPHVRSCFSVADLPVRPSTPAAPFSPGLVSMDGQHAVLLVELDRSSDDLREIVPVVAELDEIAQRASGREGVEITMAGLPAMRAAFFTLTLRDQARLVPITLLLIAAGLFLAFRSRPGVLIPALASGLPLLWLLGAMGWIGEPLGLLNQSYMTLLPVLAVAGAIHLLARVREELRVGAASDAADLPDIVARSVGHVGVACFLSAITTALGFASLALAQMPILRHFGLFAALGILFSLAVLLGLVPALLSLNDPDALRRGGHRSPSRSLRRAANMATRRPKLVLAGTTLLTLVAAWGSSMVSVDNTLGDLLQPSHAVRQSNDLIDRELGGSLALEFDVEGDFRDAGTRAELDAFMAWADAQEPVRVVLGPGRDPAARISEDGRHAWLTLRTGDMGGRAFARLTEDAADAFEDRCPSLNATPTGTAYVAYSGVNRITEDLQRSLGLVFVVILVMIGLLFRSPRLALLAALPNGLPMLMALAVFGFSGVRLDPLGAVVMTMALGVAADDTIHLLTRAREHLRNGAEMQAAISRAIETTGRAALLTTTLLVCGLGVNLLSSFPPLMLVGALGGLVISFALIADLLVLPALLSLGARRSLKR
jgi:predicted RND superfamily exporter protein